MDNCLFCKIAKKEIPSAIVYEDEYVMAFKDIDPQARYHVVIIPKEHVASDLNGINEDNAFIVGRMFIGAKKVGEILGINKTGIRVINNCGSDAHQSIAHIHLHVLGGQDMGAKIL